jgi:hypothetical protein
VYNLSIAVSSVMDIVHSRSHRGSTEIINLQTNDILLEHAMVGDLVLVIELVSVVIRQ